MKCVKFLSVFLLAWLLASCEHSVDTNNESQTANPVPELPPLKSFSKQSISSEILTSAPNFSKLTAGAERKQAFFNFLTPLVYFANEQILQDRKHMLSLFNHPAELNATDKRWLMELSTRYKLKDFNPEDAQDRLALKKRVDMVPIALALAQAANETAWGTSRFARLGNNYFGQWCYQKGCGLVPKQRDEDASHEVKRFEHAFYSIQGYLRNLNTHRTYKTLRQIRYHARQKNQKPSAIDMTEGLVNYSARKQVYVKALKHMIRYNKLSRFNQYQFEKETAAH